MRPVVVQWTDLDPILPPHPAGLVGHRFALQSSLVRLDQVWTAIRCREVLHQRQSDQLIGLQPQLLQTGPVAGCESQPFVRGPQNHRKQLRQHPQFRILLETHLLRFDALDRVDHTALNVHPVNTSLGKKIGCTGLHGQLIDVVLAHARHQNQRGPATLLDGRLNQLDSVPRSQTVIHQVSIEGPATNGLQAEFKGPDPFQFDNRARHLGQHTPGDDQAVFVVVDQQNFDSPVVHHRPPEVGLGRRYVAHGSS